MEHFYSRIVVKKSYNKYIVLETQQANKNRGTGENRLTGAFFLMG